MKLTNYHTHTWRCFHAAQVCDREYLEALNIKVIEEL